MEPRTLDILIVQKFSPKPTSLEYASIIATSLKNRYCSLIKFVVASETELWFRYDAQNNKWNKDDYSHVEMVFIGKLILDIQTEVAKMVVDSKNKSRLHVTKMTNSVMNVINKLKSMNEIKVDEIMEHCSILMRRETLFDDCKSKGDLICFSNGHFNLTKGTFTAIEDLNARNIGGKPCTFHTAMCHYRDHSNVNVCLPFDSVFKTSREKETFLLKSALKLRQSPLSHKDCVIGELFMDHYNTLDSVLLPPNNLMSHDFCVSKEICLNKQINRLVLYERFMELQKLKAFFDCDDIIEYISSIFINRFID